MTTQIALGTLTLLSAFLVAVLKYSKPSLAPLAVINPLLPWVAYVSLVVLCLFALVCILFFLALSKGQ